MISRLKGLFTNNWMAKLFCLLLALSLWTWVKVQQTAEERFDVQVEFRNLPDDFVLTQDSDRVVSVTLSGPKTTLNRIDASQVGVEIDASQFEPGENSVRILEWNLEYPRGLNIESIQPPRVNVFLERRSDKVVQVDPNIAEPPPQGFEYEVSVTPDTAVVRGASQTLEELAEIDLTAVDLSDHDTGFSRHGVPAELPGGVSLQYPDTNAFVLTFDIFEPVVTRTVSGITVDVLGVPEGQQGIVEPSEINLEIRGPRGDIEKLTPGDVVAEVRPSSDGSPTIRQARITLPDGVELAGGQPDQRTVRVRLADSQ